jgi:hypothetical protein
MPAQCAECLRTSGAALFGEHTFRKLTLVLSEGPERLFGATGAERTGGAGEQRHFVSQSICGTAQCRSDCCRFFG